MSAENLELARRLVEWFNAGDAEAPQAHSTDDVEIVPLRAAIEDTVYRGPGAAAAFAADSDESWEELRFETEALRDRDPVARLERVRSRPSPLEIGD